jgi:hypothetical protein
MIIVNQTKLSELKKLECKNKAKELLLKTDWAELPSAQGQLSNKTEFINYRIAVREFIINPVENPTFPSEPDAEWIND